MKRLLLLPLMLLLGAQTSVQTIPGDAGPLIFSRTGEAVFGAGHIVMKGVAPVLSSCGGAGNAIIGSDFQGTVTVGATPSTTCTITFALAWATAPACVVTWATGPLAAMSWTVSTTAISVTQTSTASNTIVYSCAGKQ